MKSKNNNLCAQKNKKDILELVDLISEYFGASKKELEKAFGV